jgi:hypothetical protein
MKTIWMALLVVFNVSTSLAEDLDLPTPKKGYTWAKCSDIKGAFLQPDNWHFKKDKKGDTFGFFITKEEIGTNGQFTTGMSVNVIPNIPKKKAASPYDFACQYREAARQSVKFANEWNKDLGPFKSVGFVFNKDDKKGAFTVHTLLIANNKTGTLYLVLFEAPTAEWVETWKIAEPMLQLLYIDDSI